VYEHTLHELPTIQRPEGLEVKILKTEDLALLKSVWPVQIERMVDRIKRGDLCYAGFINDTICSYHWVQYDGAHFLQQAHQYITVKKNQGWIYHVRVAAWAKGRGVNGFVYLTMLADAVRLGKTKLFIYTSTKNISNQKGLAKCGFVKIEKLFSLFFYKRYFTLYKKSLK
jgi:hypothetical protein